MTGVQTCALPISLIAEIIYTYAAVLFSGYLASIPNLEKSIHFLKEAALRLIFSNMSGKPLTVDDIHSMIDLSEFTIELPKE